MSHVVGSGLQLVFSNSPKKNKLQKTEMGIHYLSR